MSSSDEKRGGSDGLGGVLKAGRRLFGKGKAGRVGPERRAGKRIELPIPVRVSVGDEAFRPARVGEVNLPGLSLEPAGGARLGDPVTVQFDGYPGVSPPFTIHARVARLIGQDADAMAVEVDRAATDREALQNYRTLVRHYLHHKPLLDDINKGYFEGRCTSCGWVGRVGSRNPRCPSCGSPVEPIG